ncbi:MAG: hypothetical protein KDF54_03360 [Hydrogenophaga sp.]|nr:hypothetical protein [Hydrogenophaga sp.]
MPSPSFADSPALFPDPYMTDWTDHPQVGAISVPRAVNAGRQTYLYDVNGVALAITVDIGGGPMQVSRCSRTDFNGNFSTGDGVLQGDSLAGRMPVHLSFQPPLACVGAHVSASGSVGQNYQVLLDALLSDGSSAKFTTAGQLSRVRGTAPFAGVMAPNGLGVAELWFDAADSANQVHFASVCINTLLWEL